MSYILLLAT